jgi:hypothetical protein
MGGERVDQRARRGKLGQQGTEFARRADLGKPILGSLAPVCIGKGARRNEACCQRMRPGTCPDITLLRG